MNKIQVYHTTALGLGTKISSEGWRVSYYGINVFGRGIYFWSLLQDAHQYGKARYGMNNYEIVSEMIPVSHQNSVVYDYGKARHSNIDEIATRLLAKGIDVIIIPNALIENVTMSRAKGRAYLWLVDVTQLHRKVH